MLLGVNRHRESTYLIIKKVTDIFNGKPYLIISTIIMVYTLFADDVRQMAFPATADLTFSVINCIFMAYYLFEMVMFSIFQVTHLSFRKIIS